MYNLCYIYDYFECTDLVLKGYAFFRNFKPAGEFLYYNDEKLLEIYDLQEQVTKFYVNTTISEIKDAKKINVKELNSFIKDLLEDCLYYGR